MITAFGEIMLRLSAQEGKTIADSTAFGACYGGTEANVLACLENFGRRTRYLTALPDTAQTENIIDADILAKLKGKYIVNVGRGNCIDERALYSCLKEGSLAGAAIDTWRSKPKNGEKPYFPFTEKFDKLDNTVLSSHKAMQVCDGHARYVEDVTANVQMYLDGKQPKNMIDLTLGY